TRLFSDPESGSPSFHGAMSMAVRVQCPGCGATLSMEEKVFGKQVRCPRCQKVLQVPAPKSAPPADGEPAEPPKPARPREKQEAIASKPVRPTVGSAKAGRADSADRVRSRPERERKTPAGSKVPLILAIVGGTLVLGVGGLVTVWILRSEFLKPAKVADNT